LSISAAFTAILCGARPFEHSVFPASANYIEGHGKNQEQSQEGFHYPASSIAICVQLAAGVFIRF
jgi:roadblock/LC7 domain-containing protein